MSAINSAKPLQAEWTNGTEREPILADFDGDGHRTDTVRTWAVYGGAREADGQAGVVIAVLRVTEELGDSKVMWTDGYVTTIKRDEDSLVDGLVPIVDIADKTADGRDDLLLRWTDQFGTSIDTEVYSWQAKGMKCIEGCDQAEGEKVPAIVLSDDIGTQGHLPHRPCLPHLLAEAI